jgi:molybdopterin biosynthesis enzyme
MMGHLPFERVRVRAIADESLRRRPDGKVHYVRVHGAFAHDGRWHVHSSGPQASHQLAASAGANGLAELPEGNGVEAGNDVDVLLLG